MTHPEEVRGAWCVGEPPSSSPLTTHHLPTSRRAFLASGAAAVLGACGWDGGKTLHPLMYGASRFNDWFSERLFSSSRLSPKFSDARRSVSFPNYHISDMTPELDDPAAWRLDVGGLVATPLS